MLAEVRLAQSSIIALLVVTTSACAPRVTPATPIPCAGDGVVQTGSATLADGFTMPFQVYLPPCYERDSASYPVLYLIHGDGGDETNWFAYGRAAGIADLMIRSGQIPPAILVTPRVDFTRYADVANGFVPYIDDHFRTLADRQHRTVGGASGGADAASCLGLQYPALFESIGAFGGGWCLGNPELLAAVPADQRPRVFMDDGERDPPSVALGRRSAELLEQDGFEYLLNIGSGDHSYAYWSSNLEVYFRWCTEAWH